MSGQSALRIRFWGVRGSHPMPGRSTLRVGGNSSCVEISTSRHTLVFDGGTGLIGLGHDLLRRNGHGTVHIFFSHTHHDHIEGLRFFGPAYSADWTCHLYGRNNGRRTLKDVLVGAMDQCLFPVALSELAANLDIHDLGDEKRLRLGGKPPLVVHARHSEAHPKPGVVLYRTTYGDRSVVYATDVEAPRGGHQDVVKFARGADVLIHDAQYSEEEYDGEFNKVGWGHSTVRMAAEVARDAGVGQLLLYHHDPQHDDRFIRKLERAAQQIFPETQAAREGMEVVLD